MIGFKQIKVSIFTLALVLTSSASAGSTDINFSGYSDGTAISSLDGVSFSLVGGAGDGYTPTVYSGQLYNNPEGNFLYPSATNLDISFSTAVTFNSITLDNGVFNNNYLYVYGPGNTLLTTIYTSQASNNLYKYVLNLSGVTGIDYSNSGDGRPESISDIQFTAKPVAEVPEPGILWLFCNGLGLLELKARRRITA